MPSPPYSDASILNGSDPYAGLCHTTCSSLAALTAHCIHLISSCMRHLPCFSTKVYHDTSILSHILRLQALPTQTCMGYQHRQHPCFPTSCHLQRRHHRQQTANRFKWSRCWEVAVLTMLVTHTPTVYGLRTSSPSGICSVAVAAVFAPRF